MATKYTKEQNRKVIADIAAEYGIPFWIPDNIAELESSYDNTVGGDNGTSWGLFQLHWGGLAPKGSTSDQLSDPAYNTRIAIKAMIPAYNKAVQNGLSGFGLLEYVANSSGWPGHLRPEWTRKNRPDYTKRLQQVYANDGVDYGAKSWNPAWDDTSGAPSGGSGGTQGDGSVTGRTPWSDPIKIDIPNGSDEFIVTGDISKPAYVFRVISEREQVMSYQEWKETKGTLDLDKYNPAAYVFEQGSTVTTRIMLGLIGLLLIIFSLAKVILIPDKPDEPDYGGGEEVV